MKTIFYNAFKFINYFLFVAVLLTACKKDDNSPDTTVSTGSTIRTTVTGRVTNSNGNVVIGATVKLAGITTISDSHGNYLFVNINTPATRMVLNASMTGYFDCVKGKKTQIGGVNYINIVLTPLPNESLISGVSGGIAAIPGGASITFPANAFVDASGNFYSGQVKVFATHLNTGNPNFESMIPGGDLIAKNSAGQYQSLYSLGMIEAKLYDNTGVNEIKLAAGKTAVLKFPIDPSQSSAALVTIPMWHLNETTGIWQEEGEAIKTGNLFIGSVSHFTAWNCDYIGPTADITGKVVDCQGNPMANITVTIDGFLNVITDNSGIFTAWVPAGYNISCQVLQVYNTFLSANSPIQTITALGGQINIIPTLIVPCGSSISGVVKNCSGILPSSGYVYSTWNGGSNFQYTTTGSYHLFIPENTSINILATNNNLSGAVSIFSGLQGVNLIAPNLQLCNVGSFYETAFTIIDMGNPTVYQLSNIVSSSTAQDLDLDGILDLLYIEIDGISNPGNHNCSISISCTTAAQINDYYELSPGNGCFINIEIDSLPGYINGSSWGFTSNKLRITDYSFPGGIITGDFEYDYSNTGYITGGVFNAYRNN